MSASTNHANSDNKVQDAATIASLIGALTSHDRLVRQSARQSLVAMGRPAVVPLIKALADPNDHVRWEAAKVLGAIRDPAAAPALVRVLEDDRFEVRWVAGEGLIALGRDGLVPLLQTLVEKSDSVWLREGAHHVLRALTRGNPNLKEVLSPIVAALEDIEPAIAVPEVALNAIHALTEATSHQHGDERTPWDAKS